MAETWFLPPAGLRAGTARRRLAIPARLVWRDASGAVRVASVVARDISATAVVVECREGAPIPRYRLVYLQVERAAQDLEAVPALWREDRVLSTVWQVAPCRRDTGTPAGYTLRILTDPAACARASRSAPDESMAVAS